jgi:hypothetical protein
MRVTPKTRRRISGRAVLLAVLAVVVVLAALVTAYEVRKTDPARAEEVFARFAIPAGWQLADAQQERGLVLLSRDTRYYLVPGDPEAAAAAARAMVSKAGFDIEGRRGLPDCSSNHEPPSTTCALEVALRDGLWRLEIVVFDRAGAAFLGDAPWFRSSARDQIVVRIIVYY